MLVLITYDVNTQTPAGRTRLRKVAKQCTNYGQRVQNSVFECVLDAAKAREVKEKLIKLIDEQNDSLRFYYLGNNFYIIRHRFSAKRRQKNRFKTIKSGKHSKWKTRW